MIPEPRHLDRECHLIAQDYLRDEPALVSSLDFGAFVAQGTGAGPSVLIGDQSEISLLSSAVDTNLDHRMALLARNGDTVLVRRRETGFERYLAECLGMDDVTFLQVNAKPLRSVTYQLRTARPLLDALSERARNHGGLTLKAYLTTGNGWRLAQAVGERSGQRIHVCGPSPRATQRANDKLWFSQLARRVIGIDAIPPTLAAYGPAAAAGLVHQICRSAAQVVIKVPDSAGSAGNLRLEGAQVRGASLAGLRQFLLERLHRIGWRDRYPILVGVWDENVSHSPSVQMWIPHASEGMPLVEGIFEQRVQGEEATFVGAARSSLPHAINAQLKEEAARIACVLQRLGYYGRCSLDAVICIPPTGSETIHWIECNGRWGGVSIPMTTTRQLLDGAPLPAIAILQEKLPTPQMNCDALRNLLADLLFHRGRDRFGLVILSPPERADGKLVNLLAIAETQIEADEMLAQAMRRLTSVT